MKKAYIPFKISRVRLDNAQSVLQTCQVGGDYMDSALSACVGTNTGGMVVGCGTSVRGQRTMPGASYTAETTAPPS